MLSNKIVLRQQSKKNMDRHRFYQNIRNGAKEAKRSSRRSFPPAGGTPGEGTEDGDRPTTRPNSGRKTTRFDTGNEMDEADLEGQTNPPRYDSYETTSGDIRTPHQPSAVQDQSFHRTIYSPRTDRRATSRLPDERTGPVSPARGPLNTSRGGPLNTSRGGPLNTSRGGPLNTSRGGPVSPARGHVSPARSLTGIGDRLHDREDTWKSPRRENSGERSAVELKRVETEAGDDDPQPPQLVKETTTNQLMAENRLLKMEMNDVNNQMEMLKSDQEANIQRMKDARRDMETAERQHRNEIETLKGRMRDLEASKEDLVNEVESQTKKKELIWAENERLRSELERAKGVAEHEQRTAKLRERLEKEKERLEEELEKKTSQVEKLMADNELLKEHSLAAEKDRGFEEELNQVKGKLDKKKTKLAAARKAAEELKKKALTPEQEAELRGKIEKLAAALKAKDQLLEEAKKERREAQRDAIREKTDLDAKRKDLTDQISDLHSQLNRAKKANEQLDDGRNQMERDINRLKTEIKNLKEQLKEEKENALKLLRFAALEEQIGPLKESIRDREAKIAALSEKMVPLKDGIQARDAKLAHLQTEIETLRHAVEGYQRQLDAIRHDPKIHTRLPSTHDIVSSPVNPDHATAQRRLLEENGRLLTLLDHYRHLATQPPPVADEGPHFPVVLQQKAPAQRSNGELVEAKRQLRSSVERVAQLEKWLDEIYNDKNFQVVAKGQGRSMLPDLPRRLVMVKGPSTDADKKLRNGYLTDRAQ